MAEGAMNGAAGGLSEMQVKPAEKPDTYDGGPCPWCGSEEWTSKEQEFEQVLLPMETAGGVVVEGATPGLDETGAPVMQPTLVPYYRPDVYPIVLQRSVSVYGQLLGNSDVDQIRDQQNTVNRLEQKIIDRLVKAGTRITLPDKANLRTDPEDGERWYIGNAADKAMAPAEIAALHYTEEEMETELLVAPPHDDIYPLWLQARIDEANGEYNKYANSMQIYNEHYGNFVRWFASTYEPAQGYPDEDVCAGACENFPYYITAYGLAVKQVLADYRYYMGEDYDTGVAPGEETLNDMDTSSVLGLGIGPVSFETLDKLVEEGKVDVYTNSSGRLSVRWAEGYNRNNYKNSGKSTSGLAGLTPQLPLW